ncbi:MAG: VPLPA-CTERM sorting domain-containing protein [Roseobacter sp.]
MSASAVSAATFAVDFAGIATSRTGDFAAETVLGETLTGSPANHVTGSILIDSNLPFQTTSDPFSAVQPSNLDRMVVALIKGPAGLGFLSTTVNFVTLSRSLSTETDNAVEGQFTVRAIDDSPRGADDQFAISLLNAPQGNIFNFSLQAEDMISLDPSLGFSKALLESIDLNATNNTSIAGTAAIADFGTPTGRIVFSVSSYSVREVQTTGTDPDINVVPLPAGLSLLLTGLAAVGVGTRRKRRA